MNSKYLTICFLIIISIGFSNAELQMGIDGSTDEIGINFAAPINYSAIPPVNSSNYWITDIGSLNTVNATQFENNGGTLNIMLSWLESFLDNLFLRLDASNGPMQGDLDMGNYSIYNVKDLNLSNQTLYLGATVLKGNGTSLVVEDGNVTGDFILGDGRYITNLNLTGVNLSGGQVNASEFNGDNFFGGNFTGNFFGNLSNFSILTGINGQSIDNLENGVLRFTSPFSNFTGNISVNDLNIRNGSSLTFGLGPDYITTISAQSVTVPGIGTRNVLAADANSFGNNFNYEGTGTITCLNNNDSEFAASTIFASNSLGHSAAILKFGINYSDPELSVIGGNFGNVKYIARNDGKINVSFSFYDDVNRSILGDVFNYVNLTDVITINNGNFTTPFKTWFNYVVEFVNETIFREDVLIDANLNVTGNATYNSYYGEMWNYTSAGWTFDIAAAEVYYNLTNLTYGDLNGFDFTDNPQATGGSFLTANIDGKYKASFSVAFGDFANNLFGGGIAINGIIQRDCYDRAYVSNVNEVENLEKSCIIFVNNGDTIHVQIEDETSPSSDADIYQVNLNIVRIGD